MTRYVSGIPQVEKRVFSELKGVIRHVLMYVHESTEGK